ncbi:hypothetical protein T03_4958 [Trichinella britovi]|uniref:Uncharacterized protein n=1 Tax=Trichinella britovi TaxID=45882 RepID=A0A0V1CVY5_TRIBR|nr:hypothetical protein T03_4958 [Trichinella britovi]
MHKYAVIAFPFIFSNLRCFMLISLRFRENICITMPYYVCAITDGKLELKIIFALPHFENARMQSIISKDGKTMGVSDICRIWSNL